MPMQSCYFAYKTNRFWRYCCLRRRGCLSSLNWFLLPSQRLQKRRPEEICPTDTRVEFVYALVSGTVLKGHYHVIWKTSKITFDSGLIKKGSRVTLKSSFYNMYPFPSIHRKLVLLQPFLYEKRSWLTKTAKRWQDTEFRWQCLINTCGRLTTDENKNMSRKSQAMGSLL